MKKIVAIGGAVVLFVTLLVAALTSLSTSVPAIRKFVGDKIGWAEGYIGTPEQMWEYERSKVRPPTLGVETRVKGALVTIEVTSDRDALIDAELSGPLGPQQLASGVERRFRSSRELEDGRYVLSVTAQRCVRVSDKAAEYNLMACRQTEGSKSFVVDTTPPIPGECVTWEDREMVVVLGSAQDLSGLAKACVGKSCVSAEAGAFELQLAVAEANRYLRRKAFLPVTLTDAAGNRTSVEVTFPIPQEGWVAVDQEGRVRALGLEAADGGFWGNPPSWTTMYLRDGGTKYGPSGTTGFGYYGIRALAVLLVVALVVLYLRRGNLLAGMASLVEKTAEKLQAFSKGGE